VVLGNINYGLSHWVFCVLCSKHYPYHRLNMIIYNHREWFDFLHEHLFKYLFYGILFLLWMWWEEKFASLSRKKATEIES